MLHWLPQNISSTGGMIDSLMYSIYYITGAVFVLVFGSGIYFVIKYRQRPGRRAKYTHGNNFLEFLWTAMTLIILLSFGFVSIPVWAKVKEDFPKPDLTVRVTGHQFYWTFTYPGPDGKFGTKDDKTFFNQMHVPVNEPVKIFLTSADVIHGFFVPALRFKQDAVPGREVPQWFEATKTGKYEIPCSELCGIGHSGMQGYLDVDTAQEYQKWVKSQWQPS